MDYESSGYFPSFGSDSCNLGRLWYILCVSIVIMANGYGNKENRRSRKAG